MKIELKNISKSFKKEKVLDNISYTFNEKRIYGIVGANGSGKSVLLKVLAGLYKASRGEVLFDGKNYQQEKIFPHFIGAAIEYPGFINDLTGWDNLLLLAGIKKFIGKEEINEILEVVGLSKDKDKKYGTYSLGMRQKLSLAQALMEKPLIILLDEPFNGIDRASVKKIKEYLVLQKEEEKALIIITTHIKDDLEDLVDEKLYLEDGKLYEEESANYK
mgnify:FL=1